MTQHTAPQLLEKDLEIALPNYSRHVHLLRSGQMLWRKAALPHASGKCSYALVQCSESDFLLSFEESANIHVSYLLKTTTGRVSAMYWVGREPIRYAMAKAMHTPGKFRVIQYGS